MCSSLYAYALVSGRECSLQCAHGPVRQLSSNEGYSHSLRLSRRDTSTILRCRNWCSNPRCPVWTLSTSSPFGMASNGVQSEVASHSWSRSSCAKIYIYTWVRPPLVMVLIFRLMLSLLLLAISNFHFNKVVALTRLQCILNQIIEHTRCLFLSPYILAYSQSSLGFSSVNNSGNKSNVWHFQCWWPKSLSTIKKPIRTHQNACLS